MRQSYRFGTSTAGLATVLITFVLGLGAAPVHGQSTPDEAQARRDAVDGAAAPVEEEHAGETLAHDASEGAPKAAPDTRDSRMRVGVLEIRGSGLHGYERPGVGIGNTVHLVPPPTFTQGLTEILITTLIEQGDFQVLERAKINEVLAEQDLASAGRVDARTGAATGKVTGAQILITGDVTEFSYQQSAIGGALGILKKKARVGGGVGKISAKMALDLRMIDATTGEVLASSRGEGKASTTGLAADFAESDKQLGVGTAKQTPLGKAARQAVDEAVAELAKTVNTKR
jgi:curli biogenesis system outer membrane secretion channel CsgG